MDPVEVTVTCGSTEEANAIARAAVESGAATCAWSWPVSSVYRWQGDVHEDEEFVVLFKTTADRFDTLCSCIRERHSYELPAIVMIPVGAVGQGVLDWLSE